MRYLISFLTILWPLESFSADIELVSKRMVNQQTHLHLQLKGLIGSGDVGRLEQILSAQIPDYFPNALTQIRLSLDSEGGSFPEGVDLMRYVNEQAIGTVVEDGSRCLSACAIAFMGGNSVSEASTDVVTRVLHPGGVLGFHAPSLNVEDRDMVPARLLRRSYSLALKSIGLLLEHAEDYQLELTLLEKIIETPPTDMYFVRTVDDAARWGIGVPVPGRDKVPSREELARLCAYFEFWDEGKSVLDGSTPNANSARTKIPEWAAQLELVRGRSVGIPAIYAHVQTVAFEYNTYCVVEMLTFGATAARLAVINHGVNYTNGSPISIIEDLQAANITNNYAPTLFRYPPEMLISDFPRVSNP